MPVDVTVVHYKCLNCKAEDHDKLFFGESPVPALNCWNCGAGRKHPNAHEQLASRVGMVPIEVYSQIKGRNA